MEHRNATVVVWWLHCQLQKQIYAARLPPFDHPELAAGPRRSYRTVPTILRTEVMEAFFPERQGYAVLCPSDRVGDTEVSQLRTGRRQSHKGSNWPLVAHREPTTHCGCTASSVWLQGKELEFHTFKTPSASILPYGRWCSETKVTWSQKRHPPPQGIKDKFHHPAEISEFRTVQEKPTNLCFIAID